MIQGRQGDTSKHRPKRSEDGKCPHCGAESEKQEFIKRVDDFYGNPWYNIRRCKNCKRKNRK